ncbi:MAG: STAS-like domain-containing protein [Polyangiaceae bacterium]|nr:STAS-like domain-containing protein [Polyangiaceae bacterium]
MATIRIADLGEGAHVTRADGARLRALVEARWGANEPVLLDFSGVRVASVSFFDEALGLLARLHGTEELLRRVHAANLDRGDRALLNRIVAERAREREEASSDLPPSRS